MPIQKSTVDSKVLFDEQWDIAQLLVQAMNRPLTFDEVSGEIKKLRVVIDSAEISWITGE